MIIETLMNPVPILSIVLNLMVLLLGISWPPSPNLEIATNLKADCNRKWYIIIKFMLFIRFKHCTKTYLSVWPN